MSNEITHHFAGRLYTQSRAPFQVPQGEGSSDFTDRLFQILEPFDRPFGKAKAEIETGMESEGHNAFFAKITFHNSFPPLKGTGIIFSYFPKLNATRLVYESHLTTAESHLSRYGTLLQTLDIAGKHFPFFVGGPSSAPQLVKPCAIVLNLINIPSLAEVAPVLASIDEVVRLYSMAVRTT